MLLEHCTWSEVETYLERAKGVILPIGSTEQHGPNGLIGTDEICADRVARAVGEATGGLVTPALNFGMAQHHMAFCGTMSLRPQTLLAVLVDLLGSLAHHGFERCLVINGHGGNMATIMTAFSELHAGAGRDADSKAGRLRCRLRNWWSPQPVMALQKKMFGDRDGSHATASEISVTQHLHPDTIKRVPIEPLLAPASTGFTDAADFRRRYPDGRMGSDTSLARPEHGKDLFECAVEALAEDYRRFVAEP